MSFFAPSSKANVVYGLRQPGFSAHPVLKRRQKQRNELRRSASQQNRSPGLCLPVVRDAERALDYADWAVQLAPPMALQHLKGGPWPAAEHGFVNHVPLRLEDCQARLAAVERELERYKQITAGGSGFRAVKRQHDFFDNFESINRTYGVYHSASAPQLQSDWVIAKSSTADMMQKAAARSPTADMMQKSSSLSMTEPAPEPSMTASFRDADEGKGLDFDPEEDLEEDELEAAEDLPEQLSEMQDQLIQLDAKWQLIDEERQDVKRQRVEMEAKLHESQAQERELAAQVELLKARVKKAEDGSQSLRDALGVSEGKAKELRKYVETMEFKEQVLDDQAAVLRARLQTLRDEAAECQAKLCPEAVGDKSPGGRRRSVRAAACEPAAERATSLESIEREVRAKVRAELALERAAAEQRRRGLEQELAAATERHRQTEDELERLSAARTAGAEVPPSHGGASVQDGPTATAVPADAPAAGAEVAAPEPREEKTAVAEGEAVEMGQSEDGLFGLTLPGSTFIPELVFLEELAGCASEDAAADGPGATEVRAAPRQPAKCQIDLARNEVCFRDLAPTGPLHKVSLDSIGAITRPDPSGTVLELELLPTAGAAAEGAAAQAANQPLRLATGDSHAASALMAALELPHRVLPGFSLGFS